MMPMNLLFISLISDIKVTLSMNIRLVMNDTLFLSTGGFHP